MYDTQLFYCTQIGYMDEDGHVVAGESSGSYVTGECVITVCGHLNRHTMTL